jgi:hypothetical protein
VTIAVLLQSCGREDLTRRTVESFVEHNLPNGHKFLLLHADDEATGANAEIAKAAGFRTVFAPTERLGQMAGLKAMCAEVEQHDIKWVAYLENDWESVARWPWGLLYTSKVDTFRLFHERKAHEGPRALAATNCLASGAPIVWERLPTLPYERGMAHFVAPSITRADVLLPLVRECATVKDICRARPLRSVRPVENVVWHIGAHEGGQTPGFKA